ncbi:hypothetical protein DRQ19_04040 [bacterium]|nr:MAG: hypothetical protein DRQ19_04040 [bacterium]
MQDFFEEERRLIVKTSVERGIRYLQVLLDFLVINLSVALAYLIRFPLGIIPVRVAYQSYSAYFYSGFIMSILWILIFGFMGHYGSFDVRKTSSREAAHLAAGVFVSAVGTMALTFIYRSYAYSRLVLAITVAVAYILLFAERRGLFSLTRLLVRKGIGTSRILLIGKGEILSRIFNRLKNDPLTSPCVIGVIPTGDCPDIPADAVFGSIEQLKWVLIREGITELILCDFDISQEEILRIIYECHKENILFEMVPKIHGLLSGNIQIDYIDGIATIAFSDLVLKGWQRIAKRTLDVVFTTMALILLLPLFAATAVAIKVTSPGPVFFKQVRIGRNGRRFWMWKFRSMYEDAERRLAELLALNEKEGPIFKIRNDPRITPIGRFIRRYSIDELPQLFNVMLGDMSLVGPRPPLPSEVEKYESWQLKRTDTTPGMTGLWQISGRSNTSFADMVRLDISYIENWSIWLDIYILMKTIPAVLKSEGAY